VRHRGARCAGALARRARCKYLIRRDTIEVVRDYLAAGIDPARSTLVLQSEIRAIPELTFLLAMLLPFQRVMRNPTLKAELADKQLEQHSLGFPRRHPRRPASRGREARSRGCEQTEASIPAAALYDEVARRMSRERPRGTSDRRESGRHMRHTTRAHGTAWSSARPSSSTCLRPK
jgi:hypothetical protein